MILGIEILLARALRQSLPWLGKVNRLPGAGMLYVFSPSDQDFAWSAANDGATAGATTESTP